MLLAIIVAVLLGAGAAFIVVGAVRPRLVSDKPLAYLETIDGPVDEFEQQLRQPFSLRVLRPVASRALRTLGRVTPSGQRDKISHQLVLAGLDTRVRAEELVAGRLILTIIGLALGLADLRFGSSRHTTALLVLVLLTGAGYLGPQSWLNRRVRQRQEAIFLAMPDMLDLLAISVEAGVGFEAALELVCQRYTSPLALEFSRTLKEMELGLPRREALQNLKSRTEVPELSNFVLALVQADALGMPIGRVLHTQAEEMRTRRQQWARERAGKLPVKILFPLVLFIFPAVMIVVLGPATASIGKSLHH